MHRLVIFLGALLLPFPTCAGAMRDENLLVTVPPNFKLGARSVTSGQQLLEFVPEGETVQNWTSMLTEQIVHQSRHSDPDHLPDLRAKAWSSSCAKGEARKVVGAFESGYRVSIWLFVCPLNPQTSRPETMWMKTLSGNDSLYGVQYAFRSAPSLEMATAAMKQLQLVRVCDTRVAARPCLTTTP